jgi:hypothetical protein
MQPEHSCSAPYCKNTMVFNELESIWQPQPTFVPRIRNAHATVVGEQQQLNTDQ